MALAAMKVSISVLVATKAASASNGGVVVFESSQLQRVNVTSSRLGVRMDIERFTGDSWWLLGLRAGRGVGS
jgi:hypothetical protein